jgi:hypothetical protein
MKSLIQMHKYLRPNEWGILYEVVWKETEKKCSEEKIIIKGWEQKKIVVA